MRVRPQLDQEFAALSPEEVAKLKLQAEKEQDAKKIVPKQAKRAQQQDVNKVASSIQQAVSMIFPLHGGANLFKLDTLHCRTGYYGICILVRGDRSMKSKPIVAKTGQIGQFFEDVTNTVSKKTVPQKVKNFL